MKLIKAHKNPKYKTNWYILYKNKNTFFMDCRYYGLASITDKFQDADKWFHLEDIQTFINMNKDDLKGFKIAQVTLTTSEHFQVKGL